MINRKVVVAQYGDESHLKIISAEIADPGANQAQLRVLTSIVSGADVNMRRGLYPFQPKPPLTPGYCVVGKIERLGGTSSELRVGSRVACMLVTGGYSEFVNVPTKFLIPVPEGISSGDAVSLVLDGMTAYQMLFRVAKPKAGQRLFIHGASGAVGSALAQLAQPLGVEVFGTASPNKSAAVKKLGVEPYDYRDHNWVARMQERGGVDFVFDPLGYDSFDRSWSILRRRGLLIGYGMNNQGFQGAKGGLILPILRHYARNLAFWQGKRATFYAISRTSGTFKPDLEALLQKVVKGEYKPLIKQIFPFDSIQDAHRAWVNHAGLGSIVVQVRKE